MSTPLFAERVKESTTTAGVGTIDLDGTTATWQTFVAAIGTAKRSYYAIVHRTLDEWEIGYGEVTDAATDTLSRDKILASTNGDAVVNFSAGTKDVYCPAMASIMSDAQISNRELFTQAGHGLVAGDCVYTSAGDWVVAQADAAANAEVIGVVESVSGNDFTVVFDGKITLSGLTADTQYYLSASAEGALTATAPSAVGQIRKAIMWALSTTVGYVNIMIGFEITNAVEETGKNVLINGGFDVWQRATGATAMSDDAYNAPDRWYSLVQGANATIERNEVIGTKNARYAAKMIAGGTTNRFGVAQIVEAQNCAHLVGKSLFLNFQAYANLNAAAGNIDVRYAVLEWTGTADAVTSEIINDWTSGTFTTGNFFASTTLTLRATGMTEVTHNTWSEITLDCGVVSTSLKNLIVVIWHEDVPAHANDYITITEVDTYKGAATRDWEAKPIDEVLASCQRYCYRWTTTEVNEHIADGYTHSTTGSSHVLRFPVTMRGVPTITFSGVDDWIIYYGATAIDTSGIGSHKPSAYSTFIQPSCAAVLTPGDGVSLAADSTPGRWIQAEAEL